MKLNWRNIITYRLMKTFGNNHKVLVEVLIDDRK